METISIPKNFPPSTRAHVKETFSHYNQFIKNTMKYQSAIKDLAVALCEFSRSYENFLSFEPMRIIIDSNNKRQGKYLLIYI